MTKEEIVAVDLFCGVGGLTRGLENVGINVKAGIDVDEGCRYAYEENNDAEFIKQDVSETEPEEIEEYFEEDKKSLLAGCAPCQPFSNLGDKGEEHEKWDLLESFEELVREIEPDYVAMENVPDLKSKDIFHDFKEALDELGYNLDWDVVKAKNYGVPQTRRRLVLVAAKEEVSIIDPTADEEPTVRKKIEDLPELEAGEKHDEDPLHWVAGLSSKNIRRIKQSEPGGTWEDWDEELILDCHKKESGRSFDDVYGRMEWDKPAPTMTTQFYAYGSGRFGHPEQNRAISVREGAILQTFSEDYKFMDPDEEYSKSTLGKWIGNAVPVKLGEAIGKTIRA